MARVEVYSTLFCPYCSRAKGLLEKKGVDYINIDVIEDSSKRDEMVERSGGRQSVPQIFIDGELIGGYDDLYALERAGKLDAKQPASSFPRRASPRPISPPPVISSAAHAMPAPRSS
jgi:glutaredoxin 3